MNTFGQNLRVTTFGESHGVAVGAVVDGFPANIELCESDIQKQLDRRRPGQSSITTPRSESDIVKILSGVEDGKTLGTPIAMIVENGDTRAKDYSRTNNIPRPAHADYTYMMRYGIAAKSGGGRASARETVGRVAAGAVAEKLLKEKFGIEIVAFVSTVGNISTNIFDGANSSPKIITRADVDKNIIRCPDEAVAEKMIAEINAAKSDGDSIGGIITCVCRNVPAGWGDPVFGKLEAVLASAMMSIPATRGFEIGAGFASAHMRGSDHNDMFVKKSDGKSGAILGTKTNRSGGVLGGISNSEPIYFRVAFKPTPTIAKAQQTVDYNGNDITLAAAGRHDPCVLPRAVPVVEAMAALALADFGVTKFSK